MSTGRMWWAAAAGCAVVVASSASAAATPAEGDVVRTDLANGVTQAPVSIVTEGGTSTTQLVQSLLMRPGAHSGWHSHPGPEFSVITGGAVTLHMGDGCTSTGYVHGQAVFIPAGVPHLVENSGPVDATVVANYTLPSGAPPRNDSPELCRK